MIDPLYLFVLTESATVYEDGRPAQNASRLVGFDYYDVEMPNDGPAAYEVHSRRDVLVPKYDVEEIIDLSEEY